MLHALACVLLTVPFAILTKLAAAQIALNIGGALLTGVAFGIEEHEQSDITQRRIANLFRGGFIGVFTNLAWSLEQAFSIVADEASDQTSLVADLAPSYASNPLLSSRQAHAIWFVIGLFGLGMAANFVGYHIGATVFGPLSEMHQAATSPRQRGPRKLPGFDSDHAGVAGSIARFLPPLMAAYILSCLIQALMYPEMPAPNGKTYEGQQ